MKAEFIFRTIGLLTFFVLWFGYLSVSAYYNQFGIQYSGLSLDINHMIFRGITILLGSITSTFGFLILLVVSLFVVLNVHIIFFRKRISPIQYGPFLFVILFLAETAAVFVNAARIARDDAFLDTTSLPKLTEFHSKNKIKSDFVKNELHSERVLILFHNTNMLIIFRAGKVRVNAPNLRVATVMLGSEDSYVQRSQ